jgi:6-pyruvoyltetrahydropterin/6-carboxytetrahydropterin synthase
MTYLSTIELFRHDLKFSSGHFTIFSETDRECLHGHNYALRAAITAQVDEKTGLTYDYRDARNELKALCKQLNTKMLLPTKSPYLRIEENENEIIATFNKTERMIFPAKDVMLLPLPNITGEELSKWFVDQLTQNPSTMKTRKIHEISISISTTLGQQCTVKKSVMI